MNINEIFNFDGGEQSLEETREEFIYDLILEGHADDPQEAEALFESSIGSIIKNYASRYSSMEPPKVMAFKNPAVADHVAVLAAGDNMFFRFDIVNGRVVSEERYSSFKEMMDERDLLMTSGFRSIDHRSFLGRNWKKILKWVTVGGVTTFVGLPLLVALIVSVAPAAAFIASAVATGVKWGAGLAASGFIVHAIQKARGQ